MNRFKIKYPFFIYYIHKASVHEHNKSMTFTEQRLEYIINQKKSQMKFVAHCYCVRIQ